MQRLEYESSKVVENVEIFKGVYRIGIEGSFKASPGQFFMLRAWDREPVLSRPISLHDVEGNKYYFIYQVVGRGTELFKNLAVGDELKIMGPLGNGFPAEELKGKVAVVAGGIGIAPFTYLLKELEKNKAVTSVDVYAGFRTEAYGLSKIVDIADNIYITTEDGSLGKKGYVTDILKVENYSMILCCGPEIMMNKVIDLCNTKRVPLLVSTEKRMACGVGACLGCTCKTKEGNKRSCKEGPVFKGEDIIYA